MRERLSMADFDYLEENVTTIQDSIAQTESEQIFLNCYRVDPTYNYPYDGGLTTVFYLEDGILGLQYELVDEELVLSYYFFQDDYEIVYKPTPRGSTYDVTIMEMDWVE